MEIGTLNKIHLANMIRWDASSKKWAECADSRGIWERCCNDPTLVFSENVMKRLKNIENKNICVLGSGDNQAVFALAGLGAKVTSVDISEKQLQIAYDRARILGLEITFVQNDVTNLISLADNRFDFIYTGGHVAVWISDLRKYYSEAVRILAQKGLLIIDEYHPFRRIWKESKSELTVKSSYLERGPFRYMLNDDVLYKSEGNFESFEFHWTLSDFLNAVITTGCKILEVDEYGEHVGDWEGAPLKGLPENILIIAEK